MIESNGHEVVFSAERTMTGVKVARYDGRIIGDGDPEKTNVRYFYDKNITCGTAEERANEYAVWRASTSENGATVSLLGETLEDRRPPEVGP